METVYTVERGSLPLQAGQGFFFVKSGKSLYKIFVQDILYIEGKRECVQIVTLSMKLLVYRTLKEIEDQLPMPFVRVHNSYIVNMTHFDRVQDNHVFVEDLKISITDKFREKFMTVLYNNIL